MKDETIHTLLISRTLFEQARIFCNIEDKFIASAGLVILQDALELVIYACLIEIGIDEEESIEKFSFDQLLGELRKRGRKVIKSANLKALNRERVQVKHFGQVAEPATVRNFFNSAKASIDALLQDVIGKDFLDVMLIDILRDCEAKEFLKKTAQFIEKGDYYQALIEIRKAIFIEIEEDYSIEDWRDAPLDKIDFGILLRGGHKAPFHVKNKKWIDENVNDPFDYIQIDHEKLRIDLMEWGVTTQDFWNLWRLTPSVFRYRNSKKWIVKGELKYLVEAAKEENTKFCLDRAISLILKKQGHFDLGRYLSYSEDYGIKVKLKENSPLFEKASKDSIIMRELQEDEVFSLDSIVRGFDEEQEFGKIYSIQREPPMYFSGYVSFESLEIIKK